MHQAAVAIGVTPRLATSGHGDDDLTWLPAWKIRGLIERREISPVEVADHFLNRIESLDPAYHAFRMVDAIGARQSARQAERAVMSGEPLGLLHGVPIAIKEHVAVKGLTWWDSLSAQTMPAPRDSIETERLRSAGAIILGTTVAGLTTREFGDSDRQPQNPWDRQRVCGDSSSGSACAAATAMVPLTIAADGLGSTRIPGALCGLIGINPTRGRVASANWGEMNPKLLSAVGPLTRDIRDAANVLAVLAGPDGRDLMCLPGPQPDYGSALGLGIAGMRLGWTDDFGYAADFAGPDSTEIISIVRKAAFNLRNAGAEVSATDVAIKDLGWVCGKIMLADRTNAIRTEPGGEDVLRAREVRQQIWQSMNQTIADHDFLLSPTAQFLAPTRQEWVKAWDAPDAMQAYSAHTAVANLLGWPAISVPAGLVNGMPIGLQILGKPDSEPQMFQLAQAFLEIMGT